MLASKNDGSILKTVPERVFAPIFLHKDFVLMRPILWPEYYISCKSWNLELQKFEIWMFGDLDVCITNLHSLAKSNPIELLRSDWSKMIDSSFILRPLFCLVLITFVYLTKFHIKKVWFFFFYQLKKISMIELSISMFQAFLWNFKDSTSIKDKAKYFYPISVAEVNNESSIHCL